MKRVVISIICLFQALYVYSQQPESIALDGSWRVALDVYNKGKTNQWYQNALPTSRDLHIDYSLYFRGADYLISDWMLLPGTLEESNIGMKLYTERTFSEGLQKRLACDVPFWIQRTVTIPEGWNGKSVIFSMERTIGVSSMYWDGHFIAEATGYEVPQKFEIKNTLISSGQHTITVFIDRSDYRYRQVGHGIVGDNGTKWTGVLGRILLSVQNKVSIQNIQTYPDIANGSFKAEFDIKDIQASKKNIAINFYIRRKKDNVKFEKIKSMEFTGIIEPHQSLNMVVPAPVELWSEFSPNLYELKTEVIIAKQIESVHITTFGMRQFGTQNGNFTLNGKKIFLRRAEYDGASPIKNYPSMEKSDWIQLMRVAKDYGLNGLRFHTWCPPEAAFAAADDLGLYLQVELPSGWGHDEKADYPATELTTISDTYGNHPSFCMLTLGNERFTHNSDSKKAISDARQYDPRHLYSCTSHPLSAVCSDDFYEAADGGANEKLLLGIQWGGGDVVTATRFNMKAPETISDYREVVKEFDVPIVSHEAGQWAMFPKLSELSKYNGALENTNYERIRRKYADIGMLEYSDKFAMSSGKFAALLYKEELESALRTPGFGGISLLGLADYQGQNLAVVGILDAFWESKGIVTPKEHRMYCSSIVPLARMAKRVWKLNETFMATAELAHFGEHDLLNVQPAWTITSVDGKKQFEGRFKKMNIAVGSLISIGEISLSLSRLKEPQKLILSIEIPGTEIKNTWDFWVYPAESIVNAGKVRVVHKWDGMVRSALESGESILLLPKRESLKMGSRESCFTPVFWNSLFKNFQRAHTLGIYCVPSNPVFNGFPTDSFSNWQWWDIAMNANAMYLDKLPKQLNPLIQVIDSYHINDKLAYLWECKVGNGKLIVSTIDFTTDMEKRIVSKHLEKSILDYMNSEKFNPSISLQLSDIDSLFY